MTLNDIFYLCGYAWYGYGGHQSGLSKPFSISGTDLLNAEGKWISTVRAGSKFGHRMFIDNWSIVPEKQPPFTIKTNPTEQNFYLDDFFRLQKANGIKGILSLSGCFDWYVPALNGQSQRKHACYNPAMSPSDPKAWADFAHYCKLWAEYLKAQGHTDFFLQLGNEWDFPFGIDVPLIPEEYAVGAWEAFKAIRSVSPNQKVMIGCTLTPKLETFIRFTAKWDALASQDGLPKERNVTLSCNLYNRTTSTNQGSGIGATFEETDTYGKFLKPFNDWCEAEGFDWALTETGNNSSPSTSAAAMKNKAPTLEGYTLEQAQGILAIRIALICASLSKCVSVCLYHCKDGYEAEPFTYHGFNYDKDFGGKEDWSAKPARTICAEFLDKHGEWDVKTYRSVDGVNYALLGESHIYWTDKKNQKVGDLLITPMPTVINELPEPPQPTTMNLKIVNKQLQWSDGQPCHLAHADSPESRLHPNYLGQFFKEADLLPALGINTITCTMRGDDIPAINPWLNNNPAQGVDKAKLEDWHERIKYFLMRCEENGLRGVVIAYLGERTNFKSITDQQYENWFVKMGKIFQDISGQIIFGWEEIWDGSDSATMRYCDRIGSLLKSYLPNSLLMYHNIPGQKAFNAGSSFVKLVCIQETSISAMKATAQAALDKGFAVHFHEPYGLVKLSNSQDANKKIVTDLCAAAGEVGVKNVGIFANDYDLQSPDASKLSYLYQHLSQTLSGTIPNPNPMARKAFITQSTNANSTTGIEITEGKNFPTGKYAIFVDGANGVDLELFKDGVSFIAKRREGQPPLAVGGDDNGALRLKDFPAGKYRLTISGQDDINFTVGTVTPPPPVDIKGTGFVLKPDGKIEFTFENGAKKLVTTI